MASKNIKNFMKMSLEQSQMPKPSRNSSRLISFRNSGGVRMASVPRKIGDKSSKVMKTLPLLRKEKHF
jgi:hypothetical protein